MTCPVFFFTNNLEKTVATEQTKEDIIHDMWQHNIKKKGKNHRGNKSKMSSVIGGRIACFLLIKCKSFPNTLNFTGMMLSAVKSTYAFYNDLSCFFVLTNNLAKSILQCRQAIKSEWDWKEKKLEHVVMEYKEERKKTWATK